MNRVNTSKEYEVRPEIPRTPLKPTQNGCIRYITNEELTLWDRLVDLSPQGTVFCFSWWLRAACGKVQVLGYFEHQRLVAGIPLYFRRRLGFTICTTPKLTQFLGVVIEPLSGKQAEIASRQTAILRKFAEHLSSNVVFIQPLHHSLQNWLPFHWEGFKQRTLVTYLLENLTDLDRVFAAMRYKTRDSIKKAQKQGVRVVECDAEPVFSLIEATFKRQNAKVPFSRAYFQRLHSAAAEHCAGGCFVAVNPDGQNVAACFNIWDSKCCYGLASGGDPELRGGDANSLLVWHTIQFAAARGISFDFEGSMIEPIEHFFRGFGGTQVQYHQLIKLPVWLRVPLVALGRV